MIMSIHIFFFLENDTRTEKSNPKGPQLQQPPVTPPQSTHYIATTTPPPPQHIAVSPIANKPGGGGGITPPRPHDAAWKAATHTSPRPLETSLVSNRPVVRQAVPVQRSPQRALTPPTAAANYMGVQYRPLAPVPAQSPNGSTQPFVAYRRQRYDSTNSNQSEDANGKGDHDKK